MSTPLAEDVDDIARRLREIQKEEGRTPEPDFHCHVCGVETDTAPDPPGKAVCPTHCEDHDYRYEAGMGHVCTHCNAPRPDNWYDDGGS